MFVLCNVSSYRIKLLFCGNSFVFNHDKLFNIMYIKMERILCPDKLNIDPNAPKAEREYRQRKIRLKFFVNECQDKFPNKYVYQMKYVFNNTYELISKCTTYESASISWRNISGKRKIQSLYGYFQIPRRQSTTESIDKFLRGLHKLSKNCQFVHITTEQYRRELIGDAFINWLSSHAIQQHLPESQELILYQVCETARALEYTQSSSEQYESTTTPVRIAFSTENVPQFRDRTAS